MLGYKCKKITLIFNSNEEKDDIGINLGNEVFTLYVTKKIPFIAQTISYLSANLNGYSPLYIKRSHSNFAGTSERYEGIIIK
jgi:hypothetical protein